jgi:hydroxyacylglutathione hydrolase
VQQLAPGLWHLSSRLPNAINCYLAGDVLIDAATKLSARRLIKRLGNRELSGHVLTHAHYDHQGASHAICERYGCPLSVGAADAGAIETGDFTAQLPASPIAAIEERVWKGPPHPVARRLVEDDEVAGFRVLETPGHSPGHIVLWREADRVLVAGDVLNNMNVMTGRPGLHTPPDFFTPDPARNRESARRLAALEPALVVFGHGPPLRDPKKLAAFVATLSD